MKTALTWLAIIIAVIWITNDPTGAAADLRHALTALTAFARAL